MLKFILTFICLFLLLRWLAKPLLRIMLQRMVKKMVNQQQAYYQGNQPPRRPDGSIHVEYQNNTENKTKSGKKPSDYEGEYVDFEEVK